VVFYQAWAFVARSLSARKRLGVPLVIASVILFLLGWRSPTSWYFRWCSVHRRRGAGRGGDDRHRQYLDFVMTCPAFGITFEVPVAWCCW